MKLVDILAGKYSSKTKSLVCDILGACVSHNFNLKVNLLGLLCLCWVILKTLKEHRDVSKETIQLKLSATRLLEKLSSPPINWKWFVGVVPALTQMVCSGVSFQRQTDASNALEKLCNKKILIGDPLALDTSLLQSYYKGVFGESFADFLLPSEGYCMQLFDTSSDEDVNITNEIVKSQHVWRIGDSSQKTECFCHIGTKTHNTSTGRQQNEEEELAWGDVYVISAVDGASFWAYLERKETVVSEVQSYIDHWLSTARPQKIENPPYAGAFVVGHCQEVGTFRGQVVSVEKDTASVFAFDYGLFVSVEWRDLVLATKEMNLKQFKQQVVFCQLRNVLPLPADLIEAALNTLANLAKDIRYCSINFSDIRLLKAIFCICSRLEPVLIRSACNLLSNLARVNDIRDRLVADSRTICFLLDLVNSLRPKLGQPEINQALQSCFRALTNLLNSPASKEIFTLEDGPFIITLFTRGATPAEEPPDIVKNAAVQLLRRYFGRSDGPRGRPRHGSMPQQNVKPFGSLLEEPRFRPEEPRPFGSLLGEPPSRSGSRDYRPPGVPLERNYRPPGVPFKRNYRPSCFYSGDRRSSRFSRDQPSQSLKRNYQPSWSYSGDRRSSRFSRDQPSQSLSRERFRTEKPIEQHSKSEDIVVDTSIIYKILKSASEAERTYKSGSKFMFCNDQTHELCERRQSLSRDIVAKIACGFFNSSAGGSLFIGIQQGNNNIVQGIVLDRAARDGLRMYIDNSLSERLLPKPPPTSYKVSYCPVTNSSNGKQNKDRFVVEVVFNRRLPWEDFYEYKGTVLMRSNTEIVSLTANDICNLLVEEMEASLRESGLFARE